VQTAPALTCWLNTVSVEGLGDVGHVDSEHDSSVTVNTVLAGRLRLPPLPPLVVDDEPPKPFTPGSGSLPGQSVIPPTFESKGAQNKVMEGNWPFTAVVPKLSEKVGEFAELRLTIVLPKAVSSPVTAGITQVDP
jgi:hypothetical protein